jgi:biotin carboxyl carrier protein
MYKINVNGNHAFRIETENNTLIVDGEVVELDTIQLSSTQSHVLYKNKSYNLEIVSEDKEEKTMDIKVNGNVYKVSVEDQYDQLLKKLGLDNISSNKVKEIKAPMPGLVLNIIAKEGQEIKKGENLLVLEAMKMENILKSPTDGTVQKILINIGDKVEKNQVLIQFS